MKKEKNMINRQKGSHILEILKEGGDNHIFEICKDDFINPFSFLFQQDKKSLYILVPTTGLVHSQEIEQLLKEYYIHEIFDLGNCYLGHYGESFALWYISKTPTRTIKTSVFYKDAHPEKDNHSYERYSIKLPSSYTNSFLEYIAILENWHKGLSSVPKSEENNYEFNEIDVSEFEPIRAYARYYRKENEEIRRLLSRAKVVPIDEVADVIDSSWGIDIHANETITTKIINNQNVPDYPFDYEKDTLVWPFSERMLQEKEKLHINDIVVHNHPQNCFLLNFEPNVDLYDIGGTIVRAKIITPEYLFLYLKSEIASRIWKELCVSAGVCRIELFRHGAWDGKSTKTIPSEFSGFPVVLPEKPDEYYCDYFQKFSKPNDHHYTKHVDIPFGTIGDVLDREIVETIRLHNAELVGKQVREDIEELNICFSNGAYKAALILSGSILEAVLLDWLSEIDGINYFEKRVKVRKARRDKKGDLILDEEGNPAFEDVETDKLQDYIDKIKEIKKPEWMEEAEHAHEIRKKRNLVHAKLCLKKDAKIDKETCTQVIDYLISVLLSRGIQQNTVMEDRLST